MIIRLITLFWGDYRERWWNEWQERLKQAYGVRDELSKVREDNGKEKTDGNNRADVER